MELNFVPWSRDAQLLQHQALVPYQPFRQLFVQLQILFQTRILWDVESHESLVLLQWVSKNLKLIDSRKLQGVMRHDQDLQSFISSQAFEEGLDQLSIQLGESELYFFEAVVLLEFDLQAFEEGYFVLFWLYQFHFFVFVRARVFEKVELFGYL